MAPCSRFPLAFLFALILSASAAFADSPATMPSPGAAPTSRATPIPTTQPAGIHVDILSHQTCEGLGACQGASVHDGFVYLYGDLYRVDHISGPGVIRQYSFAPDENGTPMLTYTGLQIMLTRRGENLINHPTGLTWNPTFGTYLGNTVTKTKKGTIYHLNWTRMIIDRNLDNAVLNVTDDDEAVQGCRPEFVRRGDRWMLSTADYGHVRNAVRLYDPALLAHAKATSEPGVMVEQFPCTAWVQQLHWIDARGLLIIAQNQIEGRRWRLTPAYPWRSDWPSDFRLITPDDEIPYPTEMEGFAMIDTRYCVMVTSSSTENVTIGRIRIR